MHEDILRWNHKYAAGDHQVEPLAEAELAANRLCLDGNGIALELACGKGANALYLATLGYHVLAVDGAIEGLKTCESTARERQLPVMSVACDLDTLILPIGCFSLVSVVRYLNRGLYQSIALSIASGGLIFFKTFNRGHLDRHPRFNPDYVLRDNELVEVFSGFELVDAGQSASSSFILARKAG